MLEEEFKLRGKIIERKNEIYKEAVEVADTLLINNTIHQINNKK